MVIDDDVTSAPLRANMTDDPAQILNFAVNAFAFGPVALATLAEIRGGAARALGSHVVISSDRRFCGYVSGGCVEAAVAAEALLAIAAGLDRTVMFGDASPFFDIVLPCGGGITVAIHILREIDTLQRVLNGLAERKTMALQYCPASQSLAVIPAPSRAGWAEGLFTIVYRPKTRVVISSSSIEAEEVARLASSAGFETIVFDRSRSLDEIASLVDPLTAVALLHHDLEAEERLLSVAVASTAFYIGALGSTRTHRRRCERLTAKGYAQTQIDRIKAPIGMFGPTKDATSLALSVLADIAAARIVAFA